MNFSFLAAQVEPTRHEFLLMPFAGKIAFYLLALSTTVYLCWRVYEMIKVWKKGKPVTWSQNRLPNFIQFIAGQRKVRSSRPKSGAPMHLLIFYGFCGLLLATTLLALATYAPMIGIPNWHKGTYYTTFESVFDWIGLAYLAGITWAIVRRYGFRLKQMAHDWRDSWALAVLFLLGVGGFFLEAARIAVDPLSAGPASPIGNLLSHAFNQSQAQSAYVVIWWSHALIFFTFWAGLPHLKLKHIFVAIPVAAGKPDRPMGHLVPISMEEVEQTGKIGVAQTDELSRWHLMSLDACMGCGRCTEVCPAWNVGKVLNPRQVVADVAAARTSGAVLSKAIGEEALWACTTCNACVEACPVLIRHVDLIVDVRRHVVAEGQLTGGPAVMLRQTTSTGNAWGASANNREDWMAGLDVPLAREKKEFDVLFWVGCAGAVDPGAVKTTKAVAALLNKTGVDYACLGSEEACTGDPARRTGDEFLFQEMAGRNAGVFAKYKFNRIVTACPHCFNTFANEYSEFDAKYQVVHHSELLSELIGQKKLKPIDAANGSIVFHDPCYLSRVNDLSDKPRDLFTKSSLVEAHFTRQKTLCCGAGGGRMWMEEEPDQRPTVRRAHELLATDAKTVALGCPFCKIMVDTGIKQITDEEIRLADVAELLHEANA